MPEIPTAADDAPDWATESHYERVADGSTLYVHLLPISSPLGRFKVAVAQFNGFTPEGDPRLGDPMVFFNPKRYDGGQVPGDHKNELYSLADVGELAELLKVAEATLARIERDPRPLAVDHAGQLIAPGQQVTP